MIASLASDTLFTIFIFGVDGWIGTIQRHEIISLEQRLAARDLSGPKEAKFISRLRAFHGQVFQVIPYWQDGESFTLGNQIATALIAAGWTIDQPKRYTALIGVIAGVSVAVDKDGPDATKRAARELVAALADNDIEASELADAVPAGKISISVGIKP